MARRRALTLFIILLTVAAVLAASSASAYGRAAGAGDDSYDDEDGYIMGGGMTATMRRMLDDLNATAAGNGTSTTTGYISYDALSADRVPCSLRGASYYNCQPGAEANPYQRGCSAITQCRG